MEHDGLLLLEFSTGVKYFRSYQQAESYYDGTELRTCYPDYVAGLVDESEVLFEIHPESDFEDPEVKRKYDNIAANFQRQGRPYRILTETEIYLQPRSRILQRLAKHRGMLTGPDEVEKYMKVARGACPTSLGELQQRLGDIRVPLRLLAAGHLRCDLTQPLGTSATIEVVADGDALLLF